MASTHVCRRGTTCGKARWCARGRLHRTALAMVTPSAGIKASVIDKSCLIGTDRGVWLVDDGVE